MSCTFLIKVKLIHNCNDTNLYRHLQEKDVEIKYVLNSVLNIQVLCKLKLQSGMPMF